MATRRDSNQGHGQHVLLTGANGFVASYILLKLIERGFAVTATVRSQDKVDDILRTHPEWKGKANFAIVADFTSQQPFDEIFENAKVPFTFIIHAASPLKFDVQDIEKEMIEPATKGTSEMLKSALRHQGTHLKRFVLLGSAVSVLNSFEDMSREGRPYTEKDWNPVTAKHAIDRQDTVLGYNASKTQAEHAAWDFMEQNKPAFDLAVINPDIVIGPMIHPIDGPESINQTNRFAIASFIDGTHETIEDVRFPFYHFVDVRDVAQGAVDALTNPAAGGQRILLVSGLITPQLVVNTIRKHFPTLRDRVPKGLVGRILPEGVQPTDWSKNTSLNILSKGTPDEQGRWRHIELEQSIKDTVQSMIDLGLV